MEHQPQLLQRTQIQRHRSERALVHNQLMSIQRKPANEGVPEKEATASKTKNVAPTDEFELDLECLKWLYEEIDVMFSKMQDDLSGSENTGDALYSEILAYENTLLDRELSSCNPCCADVISVTLKHMPPSQDFQTDYSQNTPFELGSLRVQNRGDRKMQFGKAQESYIVDLQVKIRDPQECPICM